MSLSAVPIPHCVCDLQRQLENSSFQITDNHRHLGRHIFSLVGFGYNASAYGMTAVVCCNKKAPCVPPKKPEYSNGTQPLFYSAKA